MHHYWTRVMIDSFPLMMICVCLCLCAVFGFLFNEKCGFSAERLQLSKRRDSVESVAGMSVLLAAERVQTGSYICLDYIIGDTGISHGRHYWAFRVQPDSYLIKVGVASDSKLTEWFHNPRDSSSPR